MIAYHVVASQRAQRLELPQPRRLRGRRRGPVKVRQRLLRQPRTVDRGPWSGVHVARKVLPSAIIAFWTRRIFFHEPILTRPMRALHAPFRLRGVRGANARELLPAAQTPARPADTPRACRRTALGDAILVIHAPGHVERGVAPAPSPDTRIQLRSVLTEPIVLPHLFRHERRAEPLVGLVRRRPAQLRPNPREPPERLGTWGTFLLAARGDIITGVQPSSPARPCRTPLQ
jgi:hypothetical protein